MATDLNRLIAMGGTQIESPVKRYMATRAQMGQENRNRLAMESTRQGMQSQQQQMAMQQQKNQAEMMQKWGQKMAPIMRDVSSKPENQRQAYWDTLVPDITNMAKQSGVPINEADIRSWDQQKANTLMDLNPVKAPERASRLEGPQTVYEDWDSRLGRFKEVGRGIRSQATGEYSTFKFPKGSEAKLKSSQAEDYSRVRNQLRQYDTIEKLVSDPNFIGGPSGQAVSLINSAVQQYKQVTGVPAVVVDGKVNLKRIDKNSTLYQRVRKSAGVIDRERATRIQLAYLLAKGNDQGGRVTDKDYELADNMMSGTADVKTRLELLDYRRTEAVDSYNALEEAYAERFGDKWGKAIYYKRAEREKPTAAIEFNLGTATDKEKDAEIKRLMQGILNAD